MSTRAAIKSVKDAVAHVDVDQVTRQAQDGLGYLKSLPQNIGHDEQRLSIIGGAALGALALTRISRPSGWLALGIGAALIIRGTTGHCGLYQALGVNTNDK